MNNDLKINIEELDKEWMMLPQIYGEYSEKFEFIDIRLRQAKMNYDLRRSEVSKHIRANARRYCTEYGITTLTEGFISTLLDCDEEAKEIQKTMLSLERDKRLLAVGIRGLEMKRDALKNLTSLFQAEFFSISGTNRRMEDYKKVQEQFEGRDVRKEVKLRLRESQK